ncbi:T9SS type A sorting domain-containing protein, partial [bacterium]|nr:T9SS type A sorting domain-containing protein [bacterium]
HAGMRGRLANPGFEDQPVKSVFFFAGNWRNGVQFYEINPSSNISLFTVHPSDARHLGWSESRANRDFAVEAMIKAGVNVVNMSFWGSRGTDNWAYWSPMQTSTYAHDELFDVASSKGILIAPYIESTAATEKSPGFSFMDCFPGSEDDPAPALVGQIVDLIERYLLHPVKDGWPACWARLYDRSGEARYVVSLIHVASNAPGVTDRSFAEGFDRVADKVYQETGILVGFTLDVLPPGTFAGGSFKPSADQTGPWLAERNSVLAIQCFIPEIWTGYSRESDLIAWKRRFSRDWEETGIPFIFDLCPGYDAHVVFPGSMVYGNNAAWRDSLKALFEDSGQQGLTFNSWNGYTEGMAFMPTLQYGDANYIWAKDFYSNFYPQTGTGADPFTLPRTTALFQNHPNPFNPATTIRFSLKEASRVCLKVLDIRGRETAVLADGFFTTGDHSVSFQASGLPSGIYFAWITAGELRTVRKMVKME